MVEKYENLYFRVDLSSCTGVRGKKYGCNTEFSIDNISMTIRKAFEYRKNNRLHDPGIAVYFESDHALVHKIYWKENPTHIFDYFPSLADTIDFEILSYEYLLDWNRKNIFAYVDKKPRKRKSNHS